jgi:hypothetical protein
MGPPDLCRDPTGPAKPAPQFGSQKVAACGRRISAPRQSMPIRELNDRLSAAERTFYAAFLPASLSS